MVAEVLNLRDDEVGDHRPQRRAAPPARSSPFPPSTVWPTPSNSPSSLSYGGLSGKLTSVTKLDLKAFTDTDPVRLIVAGADLGLQNITLTNFTVSRTDAGYKVTGGFLAELVSAGAGIKELAIGTTGVSVSTASGVLDLSSTQNPANLGAAWYSRLPT